MKKWKRNLRHALEILSDVSEFVIQLREKPRVIDYASIALRTTNSIFEHTEKLRKRPFKSWTMIDLWAYKDFLYKIAKQKYDTDIIYEHNEGVKDVVIEINGVKFGWEDHGPESKVNGPFVEQNVERTKWMQAMGDMVWEYLDSNSCEITKMKGIIEDDWGDGGITVFKVDHQDNIHESQVAYNILNRSKAFLEKGYNRSIMLYGKPGTGKSSAMRFVAKQFGKYSLRINVGSLNYLSFDDMLLAIELLRPATLMIDDFDRAINPSKLLTELEEFNNNVQLLMVSVNHIENLDDAVIRPGRFDDTIEVNMLDDKIVNQLIGANIPRNIKERLKKLPIAYIVEFHKRKEVLGLEQALEEVVDLEKRIRSIRLRMNDEKCEEEINNKKRRKKRKRRKKTTVRNNRNEVEVEVHVGKDPYD